MRSFLNFFCLRNFSKINKRTPTFIPESRVLTVFSRINDADTVQIVVKGGYWILVLIIPLIVLLCSTCKIRRRLLERSFLKTMTLLKHAKDYFHDKQNNYKPVTDEIP